MTPQKAFELLSQLYPNIDHILYANNGAVFVVEKDTGRYHVIIGAQPIDWGDTIRYPLPEPKWRDAEWPRDASATPVRCRARDADDRSWLDRELVGRIPEANYRWITRTMNGTIVAYRYCQVIEGTQ